MAIIIIIIIILVRRGAAIPGVGLAIHAVEELAVPFVAAVDGHEQDGQAVDGKQGADGVELRGEDLEDDEGEAELRQCRA
jgi:hypothetical protein